MPLLVVGSIAIDSIETPHGVAPENAAEPTRMYAVAFGYVTPSREAALLLMTGFVVVSQLKINLTNA